MKPVAAIHVAIVSSAMAALGRARKGQLSNWVKEIGIKSTTSNAQAVQFVLSNVPATPLI